MSKRDLIVKKYAFIQFNCDGKTMQVKTRDLTSRSPLAIDVHVYAPWEGRQLRAKVLGLSNDLTDLTELERQYMKSLKPVKATQKSSAIGRSSSSTLKKAKDLKRKASKGIEMIATDQHLPPPTKRRQVCADIDLTGLSAEDVARFRTAVETYQPSTTTNPELTSLSTCTLTSSSVPPSTSLSVTLASTEPPSAITLPVPSPVTITAPSPSPQLQALTLPSLPTLFCPDTTSPCINVDSPALDTNTPDSLHDLSPSAHLPTM